MPGSSVYGISQVGILVVAQLLIHIRLYVTPWTAAHQASLTLTISRSLLKLMSIESVMPSNHLILCCSLFLLPSVFSSIKVFSSESALLIWWLKYWSLSPSNEYSGLISFRINWFDLLAFQEHRSGLPFPCHFLGIFLDQGWNRHLLHWQVIPYY